MTVPGGGVRSIRFKVTTDHVRGCYDHVNNKNNDNFHLYEILVLPQYGE